MGSDNKILGNWARDIAYAEVLWCTRFGRIPAVWGNLVIRLSPELKVMPRRIEKDVLYDEAFDQ